MKQSAAKHILIADDDHNILAALKLLLSSEGYRVTLASHPEQIVKLFKEESFDCVFLDLNFNLDTTSGEEGLALISQLNAIDDSIPIVVMTGWATVELAVNVMQNGASDFIQKPWENERLLSITDTQISLAEQRHQSEKLSQENKLLKAERSCFTGLIAESEAMKQVLSVAEQVAKSDINILITGDNGTGKSLLAEYIHASSSRHDQSMINVNMGAITESLFESEMFGHVKGAFTDAKSNRIGRFELADKGSLFLDEIGNIPLSQQAKLLRVLESQQFEKVGASKTQRTDARVIAATNANIEQLVRDGEFRQDLLYRLNTVEIVLPSLKQREADILPLANLFLTSFAKKYHKLGLFLSDEAQQKMLSYEWPGNIRELNHMVERAVVLSAGKEITVQHLSIVNSASDKKKSNDGEEVFHSDLSLDVIEKQIIAKRIDIFKGNMLEVAKSLGLSRSAFYRRIDKYKL
jgi:DNA-binding NtrC family response regulator